MLLIFDSVVSLSLSPAIAGHHGTTTTKVLDASKIPPTYTEPPKELQRTLLTRQHTEINAVTDSEVSKPTNHIALGYLAPHSSSLTTFNRFICLGLSARID